jgi:hypothetical protein
MIESVNEIYRFKGYWGCDSRCGLRFFRRGPRALVIFTELPDNPGTSVTNFIEGLATAIRRERCPDLVPQRLYVVEHYLKRPNHEETWDAVKLRWDEAQDAYCEPQWRPLHLSDDLFAIRGLLRHA